MSACVTNYSSPVLIKVILEMAEDMDDGKDNEALSRKRSGVAGLDIRLLMEAEEDSCEGVSYPA